MIFCLESRILGATAVIKATANEGYRFVKWDDDNTSAERSITVAEEHNYLALFEAELAATAAQYCVFRQWSDSSDGSLRLLDFIPMLSQEILRFYADHILARGEGYARKEGVHKERRVPVGKAGGDSRR